MVPKTPEFARKAIYNRMNSGGASPHAPPPLETQKTRGSSMSSSPLSSHAGSGSHRHLQRPKDTHKAIDFKLFLPCAAVFGWPVVKAPTAVWLGGGRFGGSASPLLLVAGRGSVDGAGEAVSERWRGWNRLGEGRGKSAAKGRQLKFPFNIPTSLNGSLSGKEVGRSTTSEYVPVFDIDIILAATEDFSNELGYGGFGSVYKTMILENRRGWCQRNSNQGKMMEMDGIMDR
ncbi:hypothetical protein NC651_010141 [Populus alba x Populus x berolinensis]|nr:hypothetical protein NC651_010141 [Populus alba x Populus x berolinensis]